MQAKVNVEQQGDVDVNEATVLVRHDDIVLITVDLLTKRCEVSSIDGCYLELSTTENTPTIGRTVNETRICFPEFHGWRIVLAEISRYTLLLTAIPDDVTGSH